MDHSLEKDGTDLKLRDSMVLHTTLTQWLKTQMSLDSWHFGPVS